MLPIQILNLLLTETRQFLLHAPRLSLLIIPNHPEIDPQRQQERRASRRQVQPVADMIVRLVMGQEAPGGNQTANVAHHNVETDR